MSLALTFKLGNSEITFQLALVVLSPREMETGMFPTFPQWSASSIQSLSAQIVQQVVKEGRKKCKLRTSLGGLWGNGATFVETPVWRAHFNLPFEGREVLCAKDAELAFMHLDQSFKCYDLHAMTSKFDQFLFTTLLLTTIYRSTTSATSALWSVTRP